MKKYFLTKKEKYYITEDNWKNYTLTDELPDKSYKKESSSTKRKAVVFKDNYGVTNSNLIIKEFQAIERLLLQAEKCNKEDFDDGFGKAFEVFSVSVIHNIPYKEVISKYIVHGSNDAKIDAVFYDSHKEICHVFQSKLGYLDSNIGQITISNFKTYMEDDKVAITNSSDFVSFMENFQDKERINEAKKINYVFISKPSVIVDALYYETYEPEDIFDLFLRKLIAPPVDHSIKFRLYADKNNISKVSDGEFFTYLQAKNLLKALKEAAKGDDRFHNLFRDNVRGKLTLSKSIAQTLKNEPNNFSKYNNGVSITGLVSYNGSYINVIDPSIVNGQQTIYSLLQSEDLNNVLVPVFFKGTSSETDKQRIAHYNNSQRKIKTVDLLSINLNVRKLQIDLLSLIKKDKKSYYLNIYTQGTTTYLKSARKLIPTYNIIALIPFLKLYYSIETPEDIGRWKNNFTNKLDQKLDSEITFDLERSEKVCETISVYNKYLSELDKEEKNKIKTGDLPFMYLLYQNDNSLNKTLELFDTLIKNMSSKNIKDAFRSRSIYDEIKKVVK